MTIVQLIGRGLQIYLKRNAKFYGIRSNKLGVVCTPGSMQQVLNLHFRYEVFMLIRRDLRKVGKIYYPSRIAKIGDLRKKEDIVPPLFLSRPLFINMKQLGKQSCALHFGCLAPVLEVELDMFLKL